MARKGVYFQVVDFAYVDLYRDFRLTVQEIFQ